MVQLSLCCGDGGGAAGDTFPLKMIKYFLRNKRKYLPGMRREGLNNRKNRNKKTTKKEKEEEEEEKKKGEKEKKEKRRGLKRRGGR